MSNIDVRRVRNKKSNKTNKKSGGHMQVLCQLFYHPSCVTRHRIYDRNQELVSCPGPYEKFVIEDDQEKDMKKTSDMKKEIGKHYERQSDNYRFNLR